MGIGGVSIWQLLIVAVIILLLFGSKKLRGLGGDLGGAFKGFKKAINDDESQQPTKDGEGIEGTSVTAKPAKSASSQ